MSIHFFFENNLCRMCVKNITLHGINLLSSFTGTNNDIDSRQIKKLKSQTSYDLQVARMLNSIQP